MMSQFASQRVQSSNQPISIQSELLTRPTGKLSILPETQDVLLLGNQEGQKFFYQRGALCSYSADSTIPTQIAIDDPRRNPTKEIRELLTLFHETTRAAALHLITNSTLKARGYFPEIEFCAVVTEEQLIGVSHELILGGTERAYLNESAYCKLTRQRDMVRATLNDLIDARNSSHELVRRSVAEREQAATHAKHTISMLGALNIHIEVFQYRDAVTYGVLGRAALLIRGLLHELPQARLVLSASEYEPFFQNLDLPEAQSERLVFQANLPSIQIPPDALQLEVCAGLTVKKWKDSPAIRFLPFPLVYKHEKRILSPINNFEIVGERLLNQAVSNDLCNPRGTVIVDPSLKEARITQDNWSLDTLLSERKAWRSNTLSVNQQSEIKIASDSESWKIDHSIWSQVYIQDSEKFLDDLVRLSTGLSDGSYRLPFHQEGQQIVLHFLPSAMTKDLFKLNSPHSFLLIPQITNIGIRIFHRNGEVSFNPKLGVPRISIIEHGQIDNNLVRKVTSQLVGCAVRNSEDSHWMDFPIWATGSASWLEGLSAGRIVLHDGMDLDTQSKGAQIQALLNKHWALTGIPRKLKHSEVEDLALDSGYHRAGSLSVALINLEYRTKLARGFAESLFRLNSIDDIIIAIADKYHQP